MTTGRGQPYGLYKVKLTDRLLRSFKVSRNFDCSFLCRASERPGSFSGPDIPGKTPSYTTSVDQEDLAEDSWCITSADWSQDGTTIGLAVCPRRKEAEGAPPTQGAGVREDSPSKAERGSSRWRGGDANGLEDPRRAKVLLISVKTGRLTYVRETAWRFIDAFRFVKGSARECLIASSDSGYYIARWCLDENTLPTHYPLPAPVVAHTGLDVHPTNDLFLASCRDGTVLLFHLEKSRALGHVRGSTSYPVAVFDCEGLVYACSLGNRRVHLFGCDEEAIEKEPAGQFSSFDLSSILAPGSYITSLAFSPDEKTLLVCSNRSQLVTIDAFNGTKLCEYHPPDVSSSSSPSLPSRFFARSARGVPPSCPPCPAAHTPDGNFILWGGPPDSDGSIYTYKAPAVSDDFSASSSEPGAETEKTGHKAAEVVVVGKLRGGSGGDRGRADDEKNSALLNTAVNIVMFSRTHAIMATVSDDVLALWQPPVFGPPP